MKSLRLALCLILAGCASSGTPHTADSVRPQRAVPFRVEERIGATTEYLAGVAYVFPKRIDVIVTDARLAENTPRERIQQVRAMLVSGDTAASWHVTRRSAAIPVARLRELAIRPDSVRFSIPGTADESLDERRLSFMIEGEIAPSGTQFLPANRTIHGAVGLLAIRTLPPNGPYFPMGILDSGTVDVFAVQYATRTLRNADEPPLFVDAGRGKPPTYRVTTFMLGGAVILRLERRGGTWTMVRKGRFTDSATVSTSSADSLVAYILSTDYWRRPPNTCKVNGTDGITVILEARDENQFHAVMCGEPNDDRAPSVANTYRWLHALADQAFKARSH